MKLFKALKKQDYAVKRRLNINKLHIIIAFVGFIIVGLLSAVTYTYTSRHAINVSLSEPPVITKEQVNELGSGEFELVLTEKQVNEYLAGNHQSQDNSMAIEEVWFSTEDQKFIINARYKWIPLPITAYTLIQIDQNGISFNFDKISWGKWELPLPIVHTALITALKGEGLDRYQEEDFHIPEMIQWRRIHYDDQKVSIVFGLDHQVMEELLNKLWNQYEDEILLLYSQSEEVSKKKLHHIFTEQVFTEEDMDDFINNYIHEDQRLFETLLVLLNDDMIEEIYTLFDPYLQEIPKERIYEMKAELFAEQRLNSGKILIQALDTYKTYRMNEAYLHAGHTPYDLENDQLLTVDLLREIYDLPISETFANQAMYVYDPDVQTFKVGYTLNEQQRLIFDEVGYEILSSEVFNEKFVSHEFGEIQRLKEEDQERKDIEKVLASYLNTDRVFSRYLASDGSYAFVVASDVYDYQGITSFVLKKEAQWEIIEVNPQSYHRLNEDYPEYNIRLVPAEIPDANNLIRLSYNDRLQIIQNLYDMGIIESNDYAQLEYCSYQDRFIAVRLLDGRDYVFEVSYGFLEDPQTREEAHQYFRNLPEMIFIQE